MIRPATIIWAIRAGGGRELLWSASAVIEPLRRCRRAFHRVFPRPAGAPPAVPGYNATTLRRLQIGYAELNPDGRQPVRAVTAAVITVREGELSTAAGERSAGPADQRPLAPSAGARRAMDGVPDISMAPVPPQRVASSTSMPIQRSGA